MTDELWSLSATGIANGIREGSFTSVEATRAALNRMHAVNPAINAVIEPQEDEALEAAKQADARRAAGENPLLNGVPITVKMNVDQKGSRNSQGIIELKDRICEGDSAVVANLRLAGAVILGRTNAPAFSARHGTSNELHGVTLNPWDTALSVGGSSGGAAASLAAGIGALAHGNDLGGSIRQPAHCCGVVGFRPTPGRIPSYNPGGKERPPCHIASSSQGVLSRSIADARLGFDAMAVRSAHDPNWVTGYRRDIAGPVRVAVSALDQKADDAVHRELDKAASWLAEAGYDVVRADPPEFWKIWDLHRAIIEAERHVSSFVDIARYGDNYVRNSMAGRAAMPLEALDTRDDYIDAMNRRAAAMRQWTEFLDAYPVLLTPVSLIHPFPSEYDQQGNEAVARVIWSNAPCHVTAFLGLPGLSVPTGFTGSSPIGVQVTTDRLQEDLMLEIGQAIETRACFHGRYGYPSMKGKT